MLRGGKHAGRAAVLTVAQRRGGGVRIRLITPSRILVSLSEPDFDQPVQRVGEIDLPTPFAPNRQSYQREVARELDRVRPRPERAEIVVGGIRPAGRTRRSDPARSTARRPTEGRGPGRPRGPRGPRAGGPDRQPRRLARSPVRSRRSASSRSGATSTTGRSPSRARGSPRSSTRATCCWPRRSGKGSSTTSTRPPWPVWSRSSPTSTAAPTRPPRRGSRRRRSAIDAGRSPRWRPSSTPSRTKPGSTSLVAPDPTFLAVAHAWAAGEALDDVLEDEDLSGGDFVRNVKQVIDLLGQVADVTDQPTSAAAREAAARLYRGVVAASSAVATSE